MIIFDANTPIDENTTLTRWIMARNFFKGRWADRDSKRRVLEIFKQDAHIVERVRPELLPIDLSEELSVKSDRLQIAFRRMRKRLIQKGWGISLDDKKTNEGKCVRLVPSPSRKQEAIDWVIPTIGDRNQNGIPHDQSIQ